VRLDVKPILAVGETPGGIRRVGVVTGGAFGGERLSGTVLDGGSDWQTVRSDASVLLDVRLVLRTGEGELIGMSYRGLRAGPPEVLRRIDAGEAVDPSAYYFRICPVFETASADFGWLNRIVSVGTGLRTSAGPIYSVFEVL